jgi:ribosomal protein L11 methyltransferase
MTNHCLTIGPASREAAETCAAELEGLIELSIQALSISECDPAGVCWQVDAYYLAADEASRAAAAALSLGFAPHEMKITALEQTDWVRRSLEGLAPVRAGRFFVHGSHDRAGRPPNAVAIEIEAGTAFGTGHHATTRGCLLALDRVLQRAAPRRIIDIGCGSGVLAIAASKAARVPVIACDIDPEAVRLTGLNARHNGACVRAVLADGTRHPSIGARRPYELIMANILARPLLALAPAFAELSRANTRLILSGLLSEQRPSIERVYRQWGFVPDRRFDLDGWSTLVLRHAGQKNHRAWPGDATL